MSAANKRIKLARRGAGGAVEIVALAAYPRCVRHLEVSVSQSAERVMRPAGLSPWARAALAAPGLAVAALVIAGGFYFAVSGFRDLTAVPADDEWASISTLIALAGVVACALGCSSLPLRSSCRLRGRARSCSSWSRCSQASVLPALRGSGRLGPTASSTRQSRRCPRISPQWPSLGSEPCARRPMPNKRISWLDKASPARWGRGARSLSAVR